MKKRYSKYLSVLIVVVMLVVSTFYGQVHAQEANPGDIVNDTVEASTLLGKINGAREGVSKATLTQDPSLDKVAYAYASELINADSAFRKTTNFKTLPNGKGVYSLLAANDVTGILHFNYSVWLGNYLNPEFTSEFAKKAINGDFTKVGIACATDANGVKAVVLIFAKSIDSAAPSPKEPVPPTPGDIVNDRVEASTLLGKINDARKGVSKVALTQDPGLDKVAYAYASELINADSAFRKTTNFKTLPNGKGVYSLLAANSVTGISHFNYSVWLGNYLNPELTNEFAKKAINGDFTKVGIACATDADGVNVVVLTFAK